MTRPLTRITRMMRGPGIDFGASVAYPLIPAELNAGLRMGVAEFDRGSVEVDLTYDEAIYVLEGEIEIDGDGETHRLRPGECLWMPAGRKIVYRAPASCKFLYAIPSRQA